MRERRRCGIQFASRPRTRAARATRENQMRILIRVMLSGTVILFVIAANGVSARTIALHGTFSRATVKKDCGSDYSTGHDANGQPGYGCTSSTTGNTVWCNNSGHCIGNIPGRTKPPRTIIGILHPPYAGNKSSGANTPPTHHHHHPVKIGTYKPPYAGNKTNGNGHTITIMRTEEHHSSHHK